MSSQRATRLLVLLTASLALVAARCVGDASPASDGGTDASNDAQSLETGAEAGDAGIDAAPCDMNKAFGAPQLVPVINSMAAEQHPSLSPDELVLYFSSNRDGGVGGLDIWYTSRPTIGSAFSTPALSSVSTVVDEYEPTLSSDERTLYFASPRPDNTPVEIDIYATTRASTASDFTGGAVASNLNSGTEDDVGWLNAAGTALYFSSLRAGPVHCFKSALIGGVPQVPTAMTELNDFQCTSEVLTADELRIFWASDRPGMGGWDIYTATRPTTLDTFGTAQSVGELNSTANDLPAWLSTDGCRMYMHSNRSGGIGGDDIYVATRPQ